MSKSKTGSPPGQKVKYPYPSRFGSHKSMVKSVSIDENNKVVYLCEDEHGEYITELDRIDNGLADPNRYIVGRLKKLFANDKKE